jgi:hypothetical protein
MEVAQLRDKGVIDNNKRPQRWRDAKRERERQRKNQYGSSALKDSKAQSDILSDRQAVSIVQNDIGVYIQMKIYKLKERSKVGNPIFLLMIWMKYVCYYLFALTCSIVSVYLICNY